MSLHPATRKRFATIVEVLIEWHSANRRSYIWRKLRKSPYVVLISEYMLQQTGTKQVERMLPLFLKKFPSVQVLADASTAEVLLAWQGLGYNRRALNLHKAAKALADRGRRGMPKTLEDWRSLPGVGPYTAAAVMTFSQNAAIPVVDVNIERVLSRLWQMMPDYSAKLPMRDIFELDKEILPHHKSAEWHEALMDLGSGICTKRRPKCDDCPLVEVCKSGPRFLKLEHHELVGAAPVKEPLFHKQPRRIWRGRVLTIIATSSPIAPVAIAKQLSAQYNVSLDQMTARVQDICGMLLHEGFVERIRGGKLSLPSK